MLVSACRLVSWHRLGKEPEGHRQKTPALPSVTFQTFVLAHFWPSHGLKPSSCIASHVQQVWQSCSHQAGRRHAARPLYCFAAMSTSAGGAVLFCVGVVWGDTLFLVGNLQSPDPNERPVLPTVIVMCQFHFPTQKWTRLRLRHAPEICHYPLLAACQDQLVLFGGDFLSCTMLCSFTLHCACIQKWMAMGGLMADCNKYVCAAISALGVQVM